MKKVLLVILAILVAIPVVVGLIGFLQADPQDVTVSAHIKQPPEAVFGVLADFGAWPAWNSVLSNARKAAPQNNHDVWQMDSSFGTLTNEVVELTPPSKIVTQIADPKSPLQGSWTWTLTPAGDGTDVKLTDHGQISNPYMRFMIRVIVGSKATLEPTMKALGKKFGEDVAVTENKA